MKLATLYFLDCKTQLHGNGLGAFTAFFWFPLWKCGGATQAPPCTVTVGLGPQEPGGRAQICPGPQAAGPERPAGHCPLLAFQPLESLLNWIQLQLYFSTETYSCPLWDILCTKLNIHGIHLLL